MNLGPDQDQSMRVELDDDVTARRGDGPLVCGVVTGLDPDARAVAVWDGETAHRFAVDDIETINQQGTWLRAGRFDPPA